MEPIFESGPSIPKCMTCNLNKCVICQTVLSDPLLSLTPKGLPTFIEALLERKDHVYERLLCAIKIESEFLSLKPKYHKRCKSVYTDRNKIKRSRNNSNSEEGGIVNNDTFAPSMSHVSTRARLPTAFDARTCCFLCEKAWDTKGDHQLIPVETTKRQLSIQNKAKELEHETILTKISGYGDAPMDLIAAGFRYHKIIMYVKVYE